MTAQAFVVVAQQLTALELATEAHLTMHVGSAMDRALSTSVAATMYTAGPVTVQTKGLLQVLIAMETVLQGRIVLEPVVVI